MKGVPQMNNGGENGGKKGRGGAGAGGNIPVQMNGGGKKGGGAGGAGNNGGDHRLSITEAGSEECDIDDEGKFRNRGRFAFQV
ncbi:hypothetical protein L1887_01462 [Cichorium endivia]|nr:hypothetical protein L1887_01462 [Cichorium endivia]